MRAECAAEGKMNGKLEQWDMYASGTDEKWSHRKALFFVAASSAVFWASIILLLRLTPFG
jgi:hypothetical protein